MIYLSVWDENGVVRDRKIAAWYMCGAGGGLARVSTKGSVRSPRSGQKLRWMTWQKGVEWVETERVHKLVVLVVLGQRVVHSGGSSAWTACGSGGRYIDSVVDVAQRW